MIRILSDLHLYDARTQVRALSQLEPLLDRVRTLVLNGDTCEMRRGATPEQLAELRVFFRARVPEVVFISGNHDPDISDTHEWLAADGRVWVTHGDVCFDDFTPWARHVPEIRRLVAAKQAADPAADFAQLAVRYRIAREVAREEKDLPDRTTRNWWAHLAWVCHTFFPPRQPWAMLQCWRDLAGLADRLAVTQRPAAQVVVMGHVHFPGVWRRGQGPVIVNTGSFFRPLGGNLVDVHDDRVQVRRIVRRGDLFTPGRVIAEIPLKSAS
jgi:predicted phosphodiesterase